MYKLFTILFYSLLSIASTAQIIYNNGARIVSQPGTHWVIDNGNFTIKSESATDLATMANLKIETDASLTLTPQTYLTVSGTLDNGSGNDGLVVQSTAAGTSSLINGTTGVNATIQRYITGSTSLSAYTYHFVSVPLTPATNSISNLFLGAYLYEFTPLTNTWLGLGVSTTTPLDETKGYMIYTPETSHTYEFAGPINAGSFSATVVYQGAGNNLVPNPYLSAIDWDATTGWTKDPAKIANSVYMWPSGELSGNYATYVNGVASNGGSRYIPAGQSFIVKAIDASAVLAMNDNVRVHNSQAFYKDDERIPNVLRIKAEANNYTDEAVVRFTENAIAGADPAWDAWKLTGLETAPQLYSVAADDEKLTINSLPFSNDETVVPLNFTLSVAASCAFTVSGIENFDPAVSIFLEDLQLNKMVNLRQQNTYTFNHLTGNTANRFKLYFNSVTSIDEPLTLQAKMWFSLDNLYINAPELTGKQATVEVYNLSGQKLYSKQVTLNELTVLSTGARGIVAARLISNHQIITCKGIIK